MGSSKAPRDRHAPGTLSLHGKCMQAHSSSGHRCRHRGGRPLGPGHPFSHCPRPVLAKTRNGCRADGKAAALRPPASLEVTSPSPGFSHSLPLPPHAVSWVLPPPTRSQEHPLPRF